jgi:hypothetical protein
VKKESNWAELVEEEAKQKQQQEEVLDNITLTSDPKYVSTLTFLASMLSNSSNKMINMSNESKLAVAKQLADLFIEDRKNEINK